MKKFKTEREGQIAFFENFGIDYENNPILIDNTDGVINGNILEFKLNISSISKTLFQAIKYLSKMRIKGESVPATIILIDLNKEKAYIFKSKDYFEEIHNTYFGESSKNNDFFKIKNEAKLLQFTKLNDSQKLKDLLLKNKSVKDKWLPINIDENCIRGWAERYYKENPKYTKGDFLGDEKGTHVNIKGEIREPKFFKYLINPYTKETNEKFKYLMDCLNDRLNKKDLGAFYTPIPYAKKASELLLEAIKRIPKDKDYIIIDRCAGTGNLESVLVDLKDNRGDFVIGHCILSTYEYYEYKVLNERLGDKVKYIIPPTEKDVNYGNGKVLNADALSKEFIENDIIKKYINNSKYSIILFENPPYSESGAIQYITDKNYKQVFWKNSYIYNEFSKENKGTSKNEMANLFIWSGFKYYLRNKYDYYLLFSPIKYWKSQHIISKKLIKAFVFNKKYFHATPSAIVCALWENTNSNIKSFTATAFDICNNEIKKIKTIIVKKVYNLISSLYDKREFSSDKKGIVCGMNGEEIKDKNIRINPKFNKNIIGYLIVQSFGFENPRLATNLLRCAIYNGNGFYLRTDNFLKKLPLFVAGKYNIEENWYENGIIYKTSDLNEEYCKDKKLINSCLIYTCLSFYNKCLSFKGSDGRMYQNELCFDNGTLATKELKKIKLDIEEQELIILWNKTLKLSKTTKNYKKNRNKNLKYGVYQISKDLNTFTEQKINGKVKKIYDYEELQDNLEQIKIRLKKYYNSHIKEKMFKYELLK